MALRSERGAVLVLVAVALIALVTLTAFVVDHGIMMVGRSQIQTSADAAALAAMHSMAFDNAKDLDTAKQIGRAVGIRNPVFGAAPDIQVADIEEIDCPPTLNWPDDKCIRARAFRNQARLNPLPTIFASIVGVQNQGVQAMAVARGVSANATTCLKPWAVADKWLDTQPGGWSQSARYNPAHGDSYVPPSANSPGTGFSLKDANGAPTYYGYQMILKYGNPGSGPGYSAGWAMELALNNPASNNPGSTPAYNANITGCTSDVVAISPGGPCGTTVNPSIGCLDIKTGSTGNNNAKSVGDFLAANDPSATWSNGAGGWSTGKINSTQSPSRRIVPIAVFDLPEYVGAGYTGTHGVIRVVNIVGFFLEGTCDTVAFREPYLDCPGGGQNKATVVGRLVSYPGLALPSGGTVAGAFGSFVALVR